MSALRDINFASLGAPAEYVVRHGEDSLFIGAHLDVALGASALGLPDGAVLTRGFTVLATWRASSDPARDAGWDGGAGWWVAAAGVPIVVG